jgi:hypothetical protein
MEEEEMGTEPKDAPSEQDAQSAENEVAPAPPAAFTVIHSDESAAGSLESSGAPVVESHLEATSGAPAAGIEQDSPAGEDEVAYATAAAIRDKASATAFEQNFATARDRMVAINVKALQAFLANAETNLDFLAALASVRSLSELIALQSRFAYRQVDAIMRPAAEISAMTQKTMASTVESVTEQITRSVKN